MPDLILRDIEPILLDRIRRLADASRSSLEEALLVLLDRGLASSEDSAGDLDEHVARVLDEAIAALENVPNDPGFALIGRAATALPAAREGFNQTIAAAWTSPP